VVKVLQAHRENPDIVCMATWTIYNLSKSIAFIPNIIHAGFISFILRELENYIHHQKLVELFYKLLNRLVCNGTVSNHNTKLPLEATEVLVKNEGIIITIVDTLKTNQHFQARSTIVPLARLLERILRTDKGKHVMIIGSF
jgi:hypothetical protein